MKKIAFSGFMASILMASGAALADEALTSLTTKNYVDQGLRAVYQTAASKASQSDFNTLSTTVGQQTSSINALTGIVGNNEAGLVADVAELQSAVNGLEAAGYLTLDDIAGKADQTDLDTLSGTVSGLETTVGGQATAITGLQSAVATKADASDLTTLSNKVNDVTTGLDTKASQAALNALQSQVNGLDGTAYTGTNGVAVDGHNVGLDVEAESGKMYIYTSAGWDELEVENTWDASILN